jgi:hypothetical protein
MAQSLKTFHQRQLERLDEAHRANIEAEWNQHRKEEELFESTQRQLCKQYAHQEAQMRVSLGVQIARLTDNVSCTRNALRASEQRREEVEHHQQSCKTLVRPGASRNQRKTGKSAPGSPARLFFLPRVLCVEPQMALNRPTRLTRAPSNMSWKH